VLAGWCCQCLRYGRGTFRPISKERAGLDPGFNGGGDKRGINQKGGQVRPQSALIAIGVNMRGYREVLGFWIGDSETYGSWNDFLAWLKGRGLRGVDLVVSDQHGGLVKAVETQFQEVMWQRCQTHLTRNILDACPKQLQSQLHSQLRVIWEAPDVETARQMLQRVMDILEQGFDDAVAVLNLPERHRETQRGSA